MSLQNQALTWALRRWIKSKSHLNRDLRVSRALSARVPFPAKLSPGWRIRPVDNGEWIEPVASDHRARHGGILYFHGGGYVAMSPRTHRSLTSRLAAWSNVRLFALDYRLAPEHPFPAALNDAVAAYQAMTAAGLDPRRIVIAGDSAGGGLALATLLVLRDAGAPRPAAAVLFSPWTDLAASGASIVTNAETDSLMQGTHATQLAKYYLQDTPATDPLASPVYADLACLPPLFLQVGGSEILLDDSRRVFANASRAGVEATLQIWRNVPHGWQIFAPVLPEARAALRLASRFIAEKLTSREN
jgi:epsilon-lactone hydrolase